MQATQTLAGSKRTATVPTPRTDASHPYATHYHVVSVDKAKAPSGTDGDWYRYVLAGGRSPITGLRRGNLHEVTEHAQRCAAELNLRNNGKSPSAWAPRRTRQA